MEIFFSLLILLFLWQALRKRKWRTQSIIDENFVSLTDKVLPAGKKIKFMTWNLQFMAGGVNNHFYFDKGKDPWPSRKKVKATANEIIKMIKAEDPDIILLQEIDLYCRRSGYMNQLKFLIKALEEIYPAHVSSIFWKHTFVPHHKFLCPSDFRLAIFSKYKITSAKRIPLPREVNANKIVQYYNPYYLLQCIELPMSNGKSCKLFNTHAAHLNYTGLTEKQLKICHDIMQSHAQKGDYVLLGGDLNAIADIRLRQYISPNEIENYSEDKTFLDELFSSFKAFPSLEQVTGENKEKWHTYAPAYYKEKRTDRTIDFFFFSHNFNLLNAYVQHDNTYHISDHLPVCLEVETQ